MRALSQVQMQAPGIIISACFAFAVLPLSDNLMPWVWILFACTLGVIWAKTVQKVKPINNLTLNLLAVFCMVLLIFFSGQFGLLSTMINLLIVAGCLKLITMRSFADFHMIMVVVIFLVACGFIYHQDLMLTGYYSLILFSAITSALLINIGNMPTFKGVKQSVKLIAQTLPITIILFVMVPRLPPLWEAAANKSTSTGLSETIRPGDIANLAQSSELAFRAEFMDEVPKTEDRYWRSIVLQHFDGESWTLGEDISNTERTPEITPSGSYTRYLIVAEPNDTRWQYSLDVPVVEEVVSDRSIQLNKAYQLFTQKENTKPSLYIVNSYLDAPLNYFMSEYDKTRNLQVPRSGNPRTRAFIDDEINASMTINQKVARLLSLFDPDKFSYTLKPPFMRQQPVDQFLFDYQKGFCSHYATALAYMLRLADIPARVVAGYQGGELQNDNILTVRQYDAHAWVEYWDDDKGWLRIDPTALVAPDRLTAGLFSSLSEEDSELVEKPFNLSELNEVPLFKSLNDFFVLLDHQWTQSVLRYDQDSQKELIKDWFGAFNAKNMTSFMFLALASIALLIGLMFLPYKRWFNKAPYQPEQKLFALLRKKGFEKQAQETLKQFIERVVPSLKEQQRKYVLLFVKRYYQDRYAQKPTRKQDYEELLKAFSAS
ncbi:transglutaminaseTgpA domain-containing protein [Ningiella sp. W23]|uniref:transglutaminase family protein n=1 Tax=Ningiella sp. W23 TaxID=3023715 RepID=UPI0037582766